MSNVCWCGRTECAVREMDEGACLRAALAASQARVAELEASIKASAALFADRDQKIREQDAALNATREALEMAIPNLLYTVERMRDSAEEYPDDPNGPIEVQNDEYILGLAISLTDHPIEAVKLAADAQARRDEAVAELVSALREIRVGKTHEDNAHPLGVDRSMVIRFMNIARAALAKVKP